MTPADLALYLLIASVVGWVWDVLDPDALDVGGSKTGRMLFSFLAQITASVLLLWVVGATAAVVVGYFSLLLILALARLAVHGR